MNKNRLEAFSDGVIAITITIMVLELKIPHSGDLSAMLTILPAFLSYVLSFIYVGIYWVNYHHLFQPVHKVNGRILWANLHLLFWLSLILFVTTWVAGHRGDSAPVALYGAVLLMCSVAFALLKKTLILSEGNDSRLAAALAKGRTNQISIFLYALAIQLSIWSSATGTVIYVVLAAMWFFPDRQLENFNSD